MARKIIIQERLDEPSDLNFRYVLRADVPLARRPYYADAGKVSLLKDATAEETQEVKTGAVIEREGKASFAAGTQTAAIRAQLVNVFGVFQAEVDGHNAFKFFGTYWDGVSWTNGGVN